MPTISVDRATERLRHALEGMPADDILQVYNEIFPHSPVTDHDAADDVSSLIEQVIDHLEHGLEPEEVVDLWNVVFPTDREVYFDEEEALLHFAEEDASA